MKKWILVFVYLLFVVVAHADKNAQIFFVVKHKWTNQNFKKNDVKVQMFDLKGGVIDSVRIPYEEDTFYFSIPNEGGRFIVVAEKDNMKPYCDTITIKRFHKNELYRELKPVKLIPDVKSRNLKGAEVRATKVKFFHKGDTLVYNADAFNTAEGSMLDGLISQLPGVELKSDGRIFVNGKRVESLLLNGEHFFNDERELMLENLPAYMVKHIEVYDKSGRLSEMYKRDMGDKQYVMDVKLKREYMVGLLANVEAGRGSRERYLARLFALRFTPCFRLAVVANVNNLNDERRPGEDTNWTPNKMPTGLLATKLVGLDYLVKNKDGNIEGEGDVTVRYESGDNYNEHSRETFLPDENWFSRSRNQELSHSCEVNSKHTFSMKAGNEWYYYFMPNFSFSHFNNTSENVSAMFNVNPSEYCQSGIWDSIAMPGGNELLRKLALNRSINENKSSGNNTLIFLPFSVHNIYMLGGQMGFSGSLSYNTSSSESFAKRLIDYPNDVSKTSDYQNTYANDKPNRSLDYATNVKWTCFPKEKFTMVLDYDFGQSFKHHDYEYNILSRLEDWNSEHADEHPLGTLPSVIEYKLKTLDGENSYNQNEIQTKHGGKVHLSYFDKACYFYFTVPVNFVHRRLNYYRGNHNNAVFYDGITRHNDVKFEPEMNIYKTFSFKNYDFITNFDYGMHQNLPEMTSMIESETTSDPLNIYTGNRELKKSTIHMFNLRLQLQRKNGWNFEFSPQYTLENNAIAYGSIYDKTTGIRHYCPENVNGNYMLRLPLYVNGDIDKKKKLSLHNQMWANYTHGVDLVGDDVMTSASRSIVNTWNGMERLTLNYKFSKNTIGLLGVVNVNHSYSSYLGFNSLTVFDFHYGLTSVLNLPWNMQFSTDLTMYSRRGYTTEDANTNDLVWNARISKKITKTNLTFILDGFDLLGNLSNTTHSVNSQGRIEVYSNALPRYIMAHIIYRFHKNPKQKDNNSTHE